MHEDYEDSDDYDYDYDDSHDYPDNLYKKFYFKFDPSLFEFWDKWLKEAMNEIVEQSPNVWYTGSYLPKEFVPVNSYNPGTGGKSSYQYLGSNYYKQEIWKKQYFAIDPIDFLYRKHLESHAKYFLQQPRHYKSLFDILN